MKQDDIHSPSLCGYLNFFHVLGLMEQENLITQSEKKIIKQKLTIKDPSLLQLLSKQLDDDQMKTQLMSFVTTLQLTRSKSHTLDSSPTKKQEGQLLTNTIKGIDQLIKSLNTIIQSSSQTLTEEFKIKMDQLKDVLNKFEEPEEIDFNIQQELQQTYQQLKLRYSRYMNSLLVLMDEKVEPKDISDFLNIFLKQLIGCVSFSYLLIKDNQVSIHKEDKFEQFDLNKDILDELVTLTDVTDIQQLVNIRKYFKNGNFILKLSDTEYFIMEIDENFTQFIQLANKYNYLDSLIDLGQFVIYTQQQIKVQYFSILSIGDTVQEIGLEIVRCSKYLLIEQILQIINKSYKIQQITEFQPNQVILKFKEQQQSFFYQIGMNLKKGQDLMIYNTILSLFQRYQQFIKQCYERMPFYKYFLKSKNLFMIDFDKAGKLKFLSRAIPQKIKQQFNLDRTQLDQNYKQILSQNQQLLQNIENYISNPKWKLYQQEDDTTKSYEIFIKKEEKQFKGFTLIISENDWIRKKTQPPFSVKTVKQQLLQTETMDYIKKLEEFNPDIRNSVVAMYMPQPVEINPMQQQQTRVTPVLVLRKMDQKAVVGKNSFFFKQREEERKGMKINPNKFNDSHLVLKDTDDGLDSLEFNIHLIKLMYEKQRVVWALLERNNFNQMFALPQDKLINFLNEMESQYNQNNNPYHNYDHGIAVMQSVNCFIKSLQTSLAPNLFNNFTKFCLLLSGLCHDVAHTGKTNAYEANSLSMLAIRYHDRVVLEQHHAATTVKILRDTHTNILCNFSDQDFRTFRKQLIANILATDMQEHFKMLKEFESRMEQYGNDPEDLSLLCGMITHTADFNGTARKWPQSRLWSEKINQEYRAQYEEEGKQGYPQQPFMKDLDKLHVISKNEMGFIKVIVRPLYHQMNVFGKGAFQICVNNLDETIFEWDSILQQEMQNLQQQQQQQQQLQQNESENKQNAEK